MPYLITDKCDGCDSCRFACPVNAISGDHYIQHRIDPDLCLSCGLCGELCENSAILDNYGCVASLTPRDSWKTPVIDRDACVGCNLCVDTCPMDALALSDPGFHGNIHVFVELKNPDSCISCEKCASRCPIGAIAMGRAVIEETVHYLTYDPEAELVEENASNDDISSILETMEYVSQDGNHGY